MPVWLRDGMIGLVVIALLLAAGICLLVYLAQARLIYHPQRITAAVARAVERSVARCAAFELPTADGAQLRGWWLRRETQGRAPLVIYFGGNAEEVSWLVPELAHAHNRGALLVNYRGYGLSEGELSEAALYRDALALYDHAVQRNDVDAAQIWVIGRSLGSGVATYLASQRPVAGVVLVSPYDSMVEVARSVYPFLPVDLLLRHRFESNRRAAQIHAPLLALAAAQDTLIPPERSRRLVQVWGGPARIEVLEGVDHNSIHLHPNYWPLIDRFLDESARAR